MEIPLNVDVIYIIAGKGPMKLRRQSNDAADCLTFETPAGFEHYVTIKEVVRVASPSYLEKYAQDMRAKLERNKEADTLLEWAKGPLQEEKDG